MRTTICPAGGCIIEQTPKADEPPPEGSTESTKWRVLFRLSADMMSTGTATRSRPRKASTSLEGKALVLLSAPTPIDSRSNMAGSSLSKLLTTSIF